MTKMKPADIAKAHRHIYLLTKVKQSEPLTTAELKELERYEQPGADEAGATSTEILKTQQEAADYAGVSKRTVRRWVAEGMPQAGTSGYLKLYLDKYKTGGRPPPSGNRLRIQAAEADYKETKAKLLQMELDLRQGRLIRLEDQDQKDVQRTLVLKRTFLYLGRKLAPRLAATKSARQCKEYIDKEIRAMLETFAGKPGNGNDRK